MKRFALLASAALLCLSGCRSTPTQQYNHWSLSSVGPRMSHHFLGGYDYYKHGTWREFDYAQKKDIERTLRRHFLNTNYDNPFQADNSNRYGERHHHSFAPYPWEYIHVEGLVMGALMLNPSVDIFLALPIGSLLGTMDNGGVEEFFDGIGQAAEPAGVLAASVAHWTIGKKGPVRAAWVSICPEDEAAWQRASDNAAPAARIKD